MDPSYFRPEINESIKWVSHVKSIKHEITWSDAVTLARMGRLFVVNLLRHFHKKNLGRLLEEVVKFNSTFVNTYE